MGAPRLLFPNALGYPSRLRSGPIAPLTLTVRGGELEAERVVAIVGARNAAADAIHFARTLATALSALGVVVASGGAVGIDAAAHEAALAAGGRTWVLAGTGPDRCYPLEHEALFDRIGEGPGAVVWPFPPGFRHISGFLKRNRLLAELSDAVVVVQADEASGALHAAGCAVAAGRPLWVVPVPPWVDKGFDGSRRLLEAGARPLWSLPSFLEWLEQDAAPTSGKPMARFMPRRRRTGASSHSRPMAPTSLQGGDPLLAQLSLGTEADSSPHADANFSLKSEVLRSLSTTPVHVDLIASQGGHTAQAVAAALLTLALENVVVEGPPGFFRRRSGT